MRQAFLAAAFVAGLLGAPAAAQAADAAASNYAQLSLGSGLGGQSRFDVAGVGSVDLDLDAGLFVAGAVGRSWPTGLAVEVEGLYLDNDVDSGDVTALLGAPVDISARTAALMLNAHYAIAQVGPVVPVVGAGVGFGKTKYKIEDVSDGSTNLVWQVMAGFAVPVNEQFSWDVKYRYIRGPEFDVSAPLGATSYTVEVQTSAHVLAVGGRYRF